MENSKKRDSLITEGNGFQYYKMQFAIVSKSAIFEEQKNQLCQALTKEGFCAKAYKDINDICFANRNVFTCVVVFQPMQFSVPKDKNCFWIAIQTEQLYSKKTGAEVFGRSHLHDLIPYLNRYDAIIDFSQENINSISEHTKTNTYLCELAQSPILIKAEEISECKYDILFIGNMPGVNSRRKIIMDYLSRFYRVAPIRFDLWGQKKIDAISNAKICLNLHYEEARYYESFRLDDYFSLGAFVMSEPMCESGVFKDGWDYVSFRLSNMCEKIDYYLQNDDERLAIAKHAQKVMSESRRKNDKLLNLILDIAILESYHRQVDKVNKGSGLVELIDKAKMTIRNIARIKDK